MRKSKTDLPWEEQTSQMLPTKETEIAIEELAMSSTMTFTKELKEVLALGTLPTSKSQALDVVLDGVVPLVEHPQYKPKGLEPWEQCPTVWKTKATFFQWMRGQMRRAWSRHPVKVSYMQANRLRVPLGRVTTKNPKGLVWGCKCEHCQQLFKQVECEVDHINEAGSFKGWEDFEPWMHKLMHINWDSIRIVCKTCHRIISYAARMGITFEEARLEKEVIVFTKLPIAQQQNKLEGLPHDVRTNAKMRRAAYKKILQEKTNG